MNTFIASPNTLASTPSRRLRRKVRFLCFPTLYVFLIQDIIKENVLRESTLSFFFLLQRGSDTGSCGSSTSTADLQEAISAQEQVLSECFNMLRGFFPNFG